MASTWRRPPERRTGRGKTRCGRSSRTLPPSTGPVVIAGDFNSYGIGAFLERHGYRWLTRDIDPTISIFTWDHIFVRRLAPAGPERAGVVHETRGASDHRPVWAVVVPEATGSAGLAKAAGTR